MTRHILLTKLNDAYAPKLTAFAELKEFDAAKGKKEWRLNAGTLKEFLDDIKSRKMRAKKKAESNVKSKRFNQIEAVAVSVQKLTNYLAESQETKLAQIQADIAKLIKEINAGYEEIDNALKSKKTFSDSKDDVAAKQLWTKTLAEFRTLLTVSFADEVTRGLVVSQANVTTPSSQRKGMAVTGNANATQPNSAIVSGFTPLVRSVAFAPDARKPSEAKLNSSDDDIQYVNNPGDQSRIAKLQQENAALRKQVTSLQEILRTKEARSNIQFQEDPLPSVQPRNPQSSGNRAVHIRTIQNKLAPTPRTWPRLKLFLGSLVLAGSALYGVAALSAAGVFVAEASVAQIALTMVTFGALTLTPGLNIAVGAVAALLFLLSAVYILARTYDYYKAGRRDSAIPVEEIAPMGEQEEVLDSENAVELSKDLSKQSQLNSDDEDTFNNDEKSIKQPQAPRKVSLVSATQIETSSIVSGLSSTGNIAGRLSPSASKKNLSIKIDDDKSFDKESVFGGIDDDIEVVVIQNPSPKPSGVVNLNLHKQSKSPVNAAIENQEEVQQTNATKNVV